MATVFRVEKNKDYTVMSNFHLKDNRLTLKAKGLLSLMLSLPTEWDYTIAGLAAICLEGKDAIRSAVAELEGAGYIRRRQLHATDGAFAENEYVIYESPQAPLSENPTTGNPSTDNPSPENPTQLNTDLSNNLNNTPNPPNGKRKKRASKPAPDWKPERFAGFWKYYPRGEAKQDAISAWDKLQPSDELLDTMALALKRQKSSPEWKKNIGIPYASTWLNKRRWEDEPHTAPATPCGEGSGRVVETEEVPDW